MEKQAVVKPGVTPSEVSGKPSDMIKKGQAVGKNEKPQEKTPESLRGKIPLK